MSALLDPNVGLIIWTIVSFGVLVGLLKMFAWGPLLSAIEEREGRMKAELEGAQAARAEAERIKAELDRKMAGFDAQGRELLARAAKEGEVLRLELKGHAEADAQKIRDKTRAELAEEKRRLVGELRKEVAGLSVMAAERLVHQSISEQVQKNVLEAFFKDLDKQKAH